MSEPCLIDFQDGRGTVPARRHKNPDGTEGGWVSNYASVVNTAHVGFDARVYGVARVYETASVVDFAQVFGESRVSGSAYISASARIGGTAEVWGVAVVAGDTELRTEGVCDDAVLLSNNDVFSGSAVDPRKIINTQRRRREKYPWTAYRTRSGGMFNFLGKKTRLVRFVECPHTCEGGLEEWLRLNTMSDLEYIAHAVEQRERKLT